jgi:hypothetical protein
MYNISYTTPCNVRGTITFKKQPWSLGIHTDVDGVEWDIRGYSGIGSKPYVQACRRDNLHPGLYDTSGNSCGYNQTWEPYWVEIEK